MECLRVCSVVEVIQSISVHLCLASFQCNVVLLLVRCLCVERRKSVGLLGHYDYCIDWDGLSCLRIPVDSLILFFMSKSIKLLTVEIKNRRFK
jgi:hypothetical protein